MTPTNIFGTSLPRALAAIPERFRAVAQAVYSFKIGEDSWTVDLKTFPPTCTPGSGTQPGCSITISAADFEHLLKNPNDAAALYFQGRIKVVGDFMLVTKLGDIMVLCNGY